MTLHSRIILWYDSERALPKSVAQSVRSCFVGGLCPPRLKPSSDLEFLAAACEVTPHRTKMTRQANATTLPLTIRGPSWETTLLNQ